MVILAREEGRSKRLETRRHSSRYPILFCKKSRAAALVERIDN
jgi:hypothetical protein